jgi:Plasmid pRiA4b ORF-3-like protein
MPEPSVSSIAIYQLRLVLCGVSPLVWRRLLVVSTTSIAELHEILQSAFGWSGEHLHRFLIHGAAYGIPHLGGIVFREDARGVPLSRFRLHCGERFRYEYDFTADWKLDIRLEGLCLLIQNTLFRHASAEGELRHRKIVLEPGIISSGWIGTEATCPSTSCTSWPKPCSGFLIPMATATLSAISTNYVKRSIA